MDVQDNAKFWTLYLTLIMAEKVLADLPACHTKYQNDLP